MLKDFLKQKSCSEQEFAEMETFLLWEGPGSRESFLNSGRTLRSEKHKESPDVLFSQPKPLHGSLFMFHMGHSPSSNQASAWHESCWQIDY